MACMRRARTSPHMYPLGKSLSGLNIPTGIPLVYELDESLKSRGGRYLGDAEAARKAAEAVARQGSQR